MAEISVNDRGDRKRGKPHKANLRVDFTPMVDMNLLLLTFFMFCTTLSKPQTMDIVMPTKLSPSKMRTEIPESRSTTLVLAEDNKIYYYFGKAFDEKTGQMADVKETDYTAKGLRKLLLDKNIDVVKEIQTLTKQKRDKEITEDQFKEATEKLKASDLAQFVVVKPSEKSAYADLVNALDELQICNISKYTVIDPDEGDQVLIDKYKENKSMANAE